MSAYHFLGIKRISDGMINTVSRKEKLHKSLKKMFHKNASVDELFSSLSYDSRAVQKVMRQ